VLEALEGMEAEEDRDQFLRFKREYDKLRAAGQEYAGIIACYEFGSDIVGRREYPWYSMAFAEGGDLNGRLLERRTQLKDAALVWDDAELRPKIIEEFEAIADAVAHLHRLDIIHRDIKPANVLILDEGELRLSDFGLIKKDRSPTGSESSGPGSIRGAIVGTRDYMAPEQAHGDSVGKQADVYSLGIVLAELFTGERPRHNLAVPAGSTVADDAKIHRLPDRLRELVLLCTDFDPQRRPPDARFVLNEFKNVVDRMAMAN
jgi:serine/threonine-protein kinase